MSDDPIPFAQLPDEPDALGAFIKEHPAALLEKIVFLMIGLTLLGLAGYGLFRIVVDRAAAGFLDFLFCCGAPLGIVFCVLWSRRLGLCVRVHKHGFVYRTRQGRQLFLWQDIVSIRKRANVYRLGKLSAGTRALRDDDLLGSIPVAEKVTLSSGTETPAGSWKCIVRRVDGVTVELTNSIADVPALIHSIEDKVYPRLYAEAAEALREGRSVSFGSVVLSVEGIRCDKALLTWDEFASVEVKPLESRLCVLAQGRWLSWAKKKLISVENLPVFLRLAQELSKKQIAPLPSAKKPTFHAVPCPSCNAVIPPEEIAAGWCESCGKQIPKHIVAKAAEEES
jgi:hypothetical protein